MATRNINLTDALDRFVADEIASGAYQNASEVVRAGLRLLKAEGDMRAAKLAALNAAIQEGLDDMAAGRFEVVTDISAWLRQIGEEAEAEIAAEDAAARSAAE